LQRTYASEDRLFKTRVFVHSIQSSVTDAPREQKTGGLAVLYFSKAVTAVLDSSSLRKDPFQGNSTLGSKQCRFANVRYPALAMALPVCI
jgi:hypothetical protein